MIAVVNAKIVDGGERGGGAKAWVGRGYPSNVTSHWGWGGGYVHS